MITAEMLQAPRGALTTELLNALRSLVPGATSADAVADDYAEQGNARTAAWSDAARRDEGAIAWATMSALEHRAQQILTAASSIGADGVSRSYSASQAVELRKQAAEHRATFDALEAVELTPPTVISPVTPASTRSVAARIHW